MAAANEGTKRAYPDAAGRSVGIRVQLPFEQHVNAFVTQAYEHRTFFTRLHQFVVLVSDAFVVMPGGIGTPKGNDDLATSAGRAPAEFSAYSGWRDVRRVGCMVPRPYASAGYPACQRRRHRASA